MKIGIIGSTGLNISMLVEEYKEKEVFFEGQKITYYEGYYCSDVIILFARNLYKKPCAPHLVQYKVVLGCLKQLQVNVIIGTAVVGSLSYNMGPREYVVVDQFIDMTKNTPFTAFDTKKFAFVDFTAPYCEALRELLIEACNMSGVVYHTTGCYVGVDGPRYETAAEVRAFRILGGDVVGMTNVTEAILAREMGMCYATLAIISNYGAGMDKTEILRKDCYIETIASVDKTAIILKNVIKMIDSKRNCLCHEKISDMIVCE